MKPIVASVLTIAAAHTASACDLCSVYAASEAQGRVGPGIFAGIAEQFTRFNTFQVDGHRVPNEGNQSLNSLSSQVFIGYNFNKWAGIQFNLPILYREYGYQGIQGTSSGIGDASLIGNFRIYEKLGENFTFTWKVLGGVKFPTGSTSHLNSAEEDFAPGIGGHDLTLGTGSVDGLVGTSFFAGSGRGFLTGSVQYSIRTKGDYDYQFANDWIWSGGPGVYLFLAQKHTLSLQLLVSGESKRMDTLAGDSIDDTAITAVYAGPQINFSWSRKLSGQFGIDVPISLATTGQQLVPDYRVRTAINWRF